MSPELFESRFAGALLGTMVGDVLGAPFEGQPHEMVAARLSTGTRTQLVGFAKAATPTIPR